MVIQKQLHTVDDVWELTHHPDNDNKHYDLIDGELLEMSPPGIPHGALAAEIAFYLRSYTGQHNIGVMTVEAGYHPPGNRHILLSPDVAFFGRSSSPMGLPEKFAPFMPDLAVEILSPSNTPKQIKRKIAIYLGNGTSLIWIVKPEERGVDVCKKGDNGVIECVFVGSDGTLSGEHLLPGFELRVDRLFAS